MYPMFLMCLGWWTSRHPPSGELVAGPSAPSASSLVDDSSRSLQDLWRSYSFLGPIHTEVLLHYSAVMTSFPVNLVSDTLCAEDMLPKSCAPHSSVNGASLLTGSSLVFEILVHPRKTRKERMGTMVLLGFLLVCPCHQSVRSSILELHEGVPPLNLMCLGCPMTLVLPATHARRLHLLALLFSLLLGVDF